MGEDKQLCNAAQRNLSAGVFVNGQLHPQAEKVCGQSDKNSSPDLVTDYELRLGATLLPKPDQRSGYAAS